MSREVISEADGFSESSGGFDQPARRAAYVTKTISGGFMRSSRKSSISRWNDTCGAKIFFNAGPKRNSVKQDLFRKIKFCVHLRAIT